MKQTYKNGFMLLAAMLFWSVAMVAQTYTVTGNVTDAKDGLPLPGVSIIIKGTTNGTITDFDGNYTLKIPTANEVLVFTFVGYDVTEVPFTGQPTLNVALSSKLEQLSELLVIGYGVQKKEDKTGAVANITAGELNQGVNTDPIQALQGKTAGVSITKKGGDPNSGFSVKIRGSSGFVSNTNPLYVVDGVIGVDPTSIANEDIESYNILKDASSTAIYGSRGANGVIIITTKQGTPKQGNIVEINSYYSIDQVANKLDMLSANDIRNYVSENGIDFNDGGANTDWQDAIFRTGVSQSYSLSASGGSEASTYRATLTHNKFDGVIKGSAKERTLGRINLTQSAIDGRLNISTTISGIVEHNDYISYSGNGSNDVIYQALQRNPTDPILDANGDYYELQRDFNYYNPVALIEQIQNERDAKKFNSNLKADLKIVPGLIATVNLGYIRNDEEFFYFEPASVRGGTSTGYGRRAYNNFSSKIIESYLSYNKTFNDVHNINAVAGHSWQQDIADGFSAQGEEPISDYVMSHNLGVLNDVNVGDISSYKNSNKLISFFGRAVYNYQSKYYLTATYRIDGSSRFGRNQEWGVFPSGSLSWNAKQEAFLEDVDFVSQLKLRAGFGLTGNQEFGNYNDLMTIVASGTTFNPETGEMVVGFDRSFNANPDLKWEENREYNFGIDFGFLRNRISGTLEYYDKTTYDLLASYRVPTPPNIVGNTWANAGQISNKGVELNIQAFILDKSNFEWKTNIAFTTNKMVIESLSSTDFKWADADKKTGWLSGRGLVGDQNWTQYLEEGFELGTFYMPEYAGLSNDGKFLFWTAAGGVTRDIEKAERRVVGSALPDFEIGWSNYITFLKDFDLNISFRGMYGNDVLNVTRMVFSNPGILPTLNALSEVTTEIERGLLDQPKNNSYYLEDGSFIRLDNVTLGYNLDVNKIGWLKKLRVYISSNNLLLLTNYSGVDPEVSFDGLSFGLEQYNTYPKTKTLTFGLQAKF